MRNLIRLLAAILSLLGSSVYAQESNTPRENLTPTHGEKGGA